MWSCAFRGFSVLQTTKKAALKCHAPYNVARLCVKSVFFENPAPLSPERKGKNYTAVVRHKDNILCNTVQCAHLRSATLPQAKETTRLSAFLRVGFDLIQSEILLK